MPRSLSTALVGRTVFVMGYLLALALGGQTAWPATVAAVSLALLWIAPLALRDERLGRCPAALMPVATAVAEAEVRAV